MVEVYDNIFSQEQLLEIEDYTLKLPYTCTNTADGGIKREKSGKLVNKHIFFGSCLFSRENINKISVYEENSDFAFYLFEKIQESIQKKYYLTQISVNLQHPGCNGHPHTDGPSERHKTIMLMTNCYWEEQWGGKFQIISHGGDVMDEYDYVPGRVLIFPGNQPHRGLGAKIEFPFAYRTTLVFRTEPLIF